MSPELKARLDAVFRKHARILEVEIHYMRLQWAREERDRWFDDYYRICRRQRLVPLIRRTDDVPLKDWPV